MSATHATYDELRALVRSRLAPYEVPREVECVAELPLTVTGKIRRGELRRLEGGTALGSLRSPRRLTPTQGRRQP